MLNCALVNLNIDGVFLSERFLMAYNSYKIFGSNIIIFEFVESIWKYFGFSFAKIMVSNFYLTELEVDKT